MRAAFEFPLVCILVEAAPLLPDAPAVGLVFILMAALALDPDRFWRAALALDPERFLGVVLEELPPDLFLLATLPLEALWFLALVAPALVLAILLR